MMHLLGILLGGCVLGAIVWMACNEIEERYERRTGRDWTTGEPK